MKFVLLFSQEHLNFRIAELRGICAALSLHFDPNQINTEDHIFLVSSSEEEIRLLLSRSILLKSAYINFFQGTSFDEIKRKLIENAEVLKKYDKVDESFSVRVRPSGRKKGIDCLGAAKKLCEYIQLDIAPVDLINPVNVFTLLEEYTEERAQVPRRLFFGKLIGDGQTQLKSKYNLRDRCYIGNTTMDPELAFIQSNIAAVQSGSFVLDPFVGTGGLLLPAAEFGAFVVGTELNYQIARAVGKSSRQGVKYLTDKESITANFSLYNTSSKLLSVIIADASQHSMWKATPVFDAIVTDPPYGVREKSRKVGKKERKEHWTLPGSEHPDHFPEKQKYSIEDTFLDLCNLAAKSLLINGRLTFWFPVILESYSVECLPLHPALELIENCEQPLTTRTSRRLLTYRKIKEPTEDESAATAHNHFQNGTFRDALFNK